MEKWDESVAPTWPPELPADLLSAPSDSQQLPHSLVWNSRGGFLKEGFGCVLLCLKLWGLQSVLAARATETCRLHDRSDGIKRRGNSRVEPLPVLCVCVCVFFLFKADGWDRIWQSADVPPREKTKTNRNAQTSDPRCVAHNSRALLLPLVFMKWVAAKHVSGSSRASVGARHST